MKSLFLAAVVVFGSSLALAESPPVSPVVQAVGQARLDLAALLIKALDSNLVCDTDAYPSTINELVSSATMQLDQTAIAAWTASIPANSKIKADLAFRQSTNSVDLTGKTVSVAALELQLVGTKFHSFGMGVYGSQHNVTLAKAGVATVRDLEQLETDPWTRWVDSSTTWEVVVVKEAWGERAMLKIGTTEHNIENKGGEFWLVPTNVPEAEVQDQTLSTSDSYCEA